MRPRTSRKLTGGPDLSADSQRQNMKRLKSLTLVRRNIFPNENSQKQGKRHRNNRYKTSPDEAEELKNTAFFGKTQVIEIVQMRQSKSEKKPNVYIYKPRGRTQLVGNQELEQTFYNQEVFRSETKNANEKTNIYKRKRRVETNQAKDMKTTLLPHIRSKSEQRTNSYEEKPQGKTLFLKKQEADISFSNRELFRPETNHKTMINIRKPKKKVEEKESKELGTIQLSPMRNNIEERMKRMYLTSPQKRYMLIEKGKVLNRKSMLPILNGKNISAFRK